MLVLYFNKYFTHGNYCCEQTLTYLATDNLYNSFYQIMVTFKKVQHGKGFLFPHTLVTGLRHKSNTQSKFYHLNRHLLSMNLQASTKQFILEDTNVFCPLKCSHDLFIKDHLNLTKKYFKGIVY